MRRIVVVGAGFFGRVVAGRLAARGIRAVVASRTRGDIRIDVEERGSIERALQSGDVVIDTVGPFQARSTTLIEAAIDRTCDLVDLSDSPAYATAVLKLHPRAAAAGVRVLTSCSAIAAVAAAAISTSGLSAPQSCDLFLAPASAETGNPATVRAFLMSVDWSRTRAFPHEERRGHRVDSAAVVLLPRRWPSLARTEFWVDPNAPFAAATLATAVRLGLAPAITAIAPLSARILGRRAGLFAVAVSEGGREVVTRFSAPRGSYLVAAEPAVLGAESLARGAPLPAGVVPIDEELDAVALYARLRDLGISVARLE